MRTTRFVAFLGVIAIASGAATGSAAQMGRRGPAGGDPSQRGGPQGDPRTKGERPSINPLELTIEELRLDLKLQTPQQAAWESFADKVRAVADDATRTRVRTQREPDMTGLQRIDYVVDVARNRYTAVEEAADAAKALYATLSPEQRQVGERRIANLIAVAAQGGAMTGMAGGNTPRERPMRGPQ